MTPEVAGKGRWIELPPDKCPPVDHGMVLLLHAGENSRKAGRAFFDFVLSARGQEILEKAGFSKIK